MLGGGLIFHIQIMIWFMLAGGYGLNPGKFEGPVLVAMSVTQQLLPLAILELYFFTQAKTYAWLHMATAATVCVFTAATLAGTYAAISGVWLPRI